MLQALHGSARVHPYLFLILCCSGRIRVHRRSVLPSAILHEGRLRLHLSTLSLW